MRDHAAWITAAFVCAVTVAAPAPRAGAFTAGVLRRDGLIVPFATWDGRRWRNDWPHPEQNPDVPISLASVPSDWWGHAHPTATWRAWVGGSAPQAVHVLQPDWFKAQCLKQIGLRTDYRATHPPPPPTVQPYPKDGLAVSSGQPVAPIEILPAGQPPPTLIEAFDQSETRLMRGIRLPEGVPFDPRRRNRLPVTIEAAYSFDDVASARYYYFEVSREYRKTDRASCAAVAFGAGWFVGHGGDSLKSLGVDVSLAECDRYGLAYMLPFGVVRLNGRAYWIAQWSGWDYEHYAIVELTPKRARPVLDVYGGSC